MARHSERCSGFSWGCSALFAVAAARHMAAHAAPVTRPRRGKARTEVTFSSNAHESCALAAEGAIACPSYRVASARVEASRCSRRAALSRVAHGPSRLCCRARVRTGRAHSPRRPAAAPHVCSSRTGRTWQPARAEVAPRPESRARICRRRPRSHPRDVSPRLR